MSENELLRRALRLYAGDQVLQRVLSTGAEALEPLSEWRRMTLLFQDVDGFTSIDEPLTAADLSRTMNQYLAQSAACIHSHGGMVVQFLGDTVFAVFGIESQDRHEQRAARCAVDLVKIASDTEQPGIASDLPGFGVRVGINTGSTCIGSFGSVQRLQFMALGDAVNLASRLCGLARNYSTRVLLTGETATALGEGLSTRHLGAVCVKGRDEQVHLYSLET